MKTPFAWRRLLAWIAAIMVALVLIAVVAIAAAPVGWLKDRVAAELGDATGAPARVGSVERAEAFSFTPTIIIRDIAIAQPEWAGRGDLLTLKEARLRVPVLRVLTGGFDPDGIRLSGLRAHLIRDAQGRESWRRERQPSDGGDSRLTLSDISISDAVIRYDDAKRDRQAVLNAVFDAQGLRMSGKGTIRGNPVTITARGAAIGKAGGPWPFSATIDGDAVAMQLDGQMDGPLDTGHFTGKVTARGNSLRTLDAIIEAGLPGTQPVRLTADIRRESPDWIVTNLKGKIGRSDFAGDLSVKKRDGRTKLEGRMTSTGFDFDDLSDAAGRARGAAKRARIGPRVVPDTDIDIANMHKTDGRLEFDIRRLLWRKPAPFRAAKGVLTLDNLLLTIDPVTVPLRHGTMSGRVTVDQRGGRKVPLLTLDLTLRGSTLATFSGDTQFSGNLRGRGKITGPGKTVRQAVGNASGFVGLVASDGALPARMASFVGLDIGRGVTTDGDDSATLRCLVFRMDMKGGTGRMAPLLIDTSRSQANVTGTIDMKTERLHWQLTGAPKKRSLLRYDKPLPIGGTIKNPEAFPPKGTKTVGSVLGMLGKAITGKQKPLATNANCAALTARALR